MIICKKTGEKAMVDVFKEKICNYCRNTECKNNIVIKDEQGVIYSKCTDYLRDDSKIMPYEKPAFITAKKIFIET